MMAAAAASASASGGETEMRSPSWLAATARTDSVKYQNMSSQIVRSFFHFGDSHF